MIGMVYGFFSSWSYWTAFTLEVILLQFIILYLLTLIYTSKNIYYSLLYTTLLFFFFGIYLAFWQLDIYTGFLWLLELTIIFVFLLVLFYLNFKGFVGSVEDKDQYTYKYIVVLLFLCINSLFISDFELSFYEEVSVIYVGWENYYEALLNHGMNDFSAFLLSYYDFNALEFIIIGTILFFGSMVCVNLYKVNKDITTENTLSFASIFNVCKDQISFNFLRKQNMFSQNLTSPSTRVVNKK
jgi:hypothetical protein